MTNQGHDGFVSGYGIASTWEQSIRLLLSRQQSSVIDTDTGGATIEIEGIILRVANPMSEPRLSDRFVNRDLIDGFRSLFYEPSRRGPQDALTVADRMYAWPTTEGRRLDQMGTIISELRANPTSRRAIVQIWHPELDLHKKSGGTPSGHCYLYFAIRDGALNLVVNSRSIDAWNGQLPNMIALSSVQEEVANRLKLPVGAYTHFVISYHMYLRDIPLALATMENSN